MDPSKSNVARRYRLCEALLDWFTARQVHSQRLCGEEQPKQGRSRQVFRQRGGAVTTVAAKRTSSAAPFLHSVR
ncbi:hypothetical protein E2C01_090625 [Portunus trituberculatus]|uniref:Uncharacterized protein n=1 Tax=Portunus trituberculatus TaxID=210409 RepID=A0A5B7JLD4_PORTR|nr:hypothetical protein [Portunus trituberculatus]